MAAPVLGNPDLAQTRRLFVLASGDPNTVERVRPLLERLGQRLFVIGDDAGAANVMKLAGNALTASTLQSMGEVLALLRKAGIDPHLAFDVLTGSLFDGQVHKTYGGKIVDQRYDPPGMTAPLAMKDLRLAQPKRKHGLCRCRSSASFTIVSSPWWRAAGRVSTGRRSACSRRAKPA